MKSIPHSSSCLVLALLLAGCSHSSHIQSPGPISGGKTRLPNGWLLSPAGKQVTVDELPLNVNIAPDGKYALSTNNGDGRQSISVVDLQSWQTVQLITVRKSWLGLRLFDNGRRFVVSGGNDNRVFIYDFADGHGMLVDSIVLGEPWPKQKINIQGLDVDGEGRTLYLTTRYDKSLYVFDLQSKKQLKKLEFPSIPYTCLSSRNGNSMFVSLWGGSQIAVVDRSSFEIVATIPVGDHPNDMAESTDGGRLFVANANQNTVSVISVKERRVIETLSSSIYPNAPNGSTPNSVALSPDGKRLYIANADNNYLAVMDVSDPGRSRPLGFIPVGWYPTCIRVVPATGQLVVANGKGLMSAPNPKGPTPGRANPHEEYIGQMFKGTLSLIEPPTGEELQRYTAQVYENTRYSDARNAAPFGGEPNPIPRKVGEPSPIKHVFYVIKENRTYDQVFGDIKEGNGDSSLCLFPEVVTPNHHALARDFVLLDNFYCDAEVSADGHNWSMAAYATDYTEKTWPTEYGGRGGDYEYGGGHPIVYPSAGYIWDNCKSNGVSYRSYGEFVHNPGERGDSAKAAIESLEGHVAPYFRGWDLDFSDVDRVKQWEKEFEAYEKNGNLSALSIITLPNDHTAGSKKEQLTPRAFVAQNDFALGMLVERISKSRYWKESVIFSIEDDAQDGPDHVDAHRTVALVISPYTKRHSVDSELYSTSSMVRTMELILGLPPMSQFDAAAMPMYRSFQMTPDFSPYVTRPAGWDLKEKNIAGAYGQERSGEFDFSRVDAIPEREMNEILWKSVKGESSTMPSPVRSAFVRLIERGEDGE